MNLVQNFLTQNPCYVANVNNADSRYVTFHQRGPLGGMLHSVGCAQPNASVFLNAWNKSSYEYSCVHGIIDANTGTAYQCLPWNYRGWHGGGSSNNTHIGVEMCESSAIRYLQEGESGYAPGKFVIKDRIKAQADCTRAYNTAVELFATLALLWHWDVDTAILSHYEGGKKGIASGHGDPEHYWSGLGMNYTMNGFRADVKIAMQPVIVNPFDDVKESNWFYDDVMWGVETGLAKGMDDTHFKPNDPCTRAQTMALMHRLAELLKEGG